MSKWIHGGLAALAAQLILVGCSSSDGGGGGDTGGGVTLPPAGTNTGTTTPAGGDTTNTVAMPGAGAAGAPATGGNGDAPATGDGMDTGADMGTDTTGDGTAGTDAAPGGDGDAMDPGVVMPSPGIDRTGFIDQCRPGGEAWGTPDQSGPCASSLSRYGLVMEYGPYGASSEYNVGQGFENFVSPNEAFCSGFIDAFGADPEGAAILKNTHDLDLGLYTIYYPGDMPEGETFPLLAWGNGTCSMPEGYGTLLRYVASYGYIVVAPNSRYVGSGAAQINAIDFMLAENDDPSSKYYQKIDASKVGAFGHSQGSGGTTNASSDARITAVILFNFQVQASKPFLAFSGEFDTYGPGSAAGMRNSVNASPQAAAYVYFEQIPTMIDGRPTGASRGHLTLMMEPERVAEPTVAWFDMMLKGDDSARSMFLGETCTLCDSTAYASEWSNDAPDMVYGHNDNLQ